MSNAVIITEPSARGPIGIVGAPMPFQLTGEYSGPDRVFAFIQRRLQDGPYCAETPASLEDIAVELTQPQGEPPSPTPQYSQTYAWTPTEVGEYTLCAYLDAAAADPPAAINFVQLSARPAPGRLSLGVTAEPNAPQRMIVSVEGEAVVPSAVSASIQEPGMPCALADGELAGQPLAVRPGSTDTVAGGPFTVPYAFLAAEPGSYEICAFLSPTPTALMYLKRPYEVGSIDFSVQPPALEAPRPANQPRAEAPRPALSGVGISNRLFRVGVGGSRRTARVPTGTTVRFSLSQPATVTIAIARLLPGVAHGRDCEPTRAGGVPARARRCTRSVAVDPSVVVQEAAGHDAIPFSGVLGRTRLVAGYYRALVTADNANGRSAPVQLRFDVKA